MAASSNAQAAPRNLPRRYRWLRFSLRSILLITLLVGIWLGIQVNRAHRQRKAVAALKQQGARIAYAYEYNDAAIRRPTAPDWLRHLCGEEYFVSVHAVYLSPGKQISAADWTHLQNLPDLKQLYLGATNVADEDLQRLRSFPALETLSLSHTQISDAGLAQLGELSSLKTLYLEGTQVSDAGLEHLSSLERLTWLGVSKTRVTAAGIGRLQSRLPGLTVVQGTEMYPSGP